MHSFYIKISRILIGTLCVGIVVFASSGMAAPEGGRSSPVKVAEAKQVLMAPQTWVAGTVISRHEARLAAEVAGRLVLVKEVGTRVKEGDVVARIDPTFVKLKIEELQARVEADRARLAFLKSEVRRNERLATQNNAAQTRLDELRADREVARSELQISQVRLKQAQEELRRHVIRSPFTGVVVERLMRRGERVAVGDNVARVIDSRALEVQAWVPLETLDFVREGDALTLKINDQEINAPVRALVAAGNARSRLLDLRISLDDDVWTAGQTVRVALPVATAKTVLAVPRDALVLRRDGAFVFRITAENKAQRIAVKPGVASGPLVAVAGELNVGDKVVVRGGERLRPGSTVKILNETP
ncbi:MAG: efflux RND transporter periplasmic adaptor subunit [Gammaproteobacteria bacterium]|nr:efflux RND transporter periplasmic adaptor subunit [Gammaproteobacteria bacterium]MCF6260404.1 efflux RND transporter periplasmic adaptor subunit [Gammaproteobacteria bacterium]